ncbi:hypothetical protein DFH09DRAFT_1087257 [Mycena vulgaris]|nr:hypothetical protein DFH09DRAFT_1087257 [Mycena vulgaris]
MFLDTEFTVSVKAPPTKKSPMASERSHHRSHPGYARKDQGSLCRVSKLFQELCLPVLNRIVELGHYASAIVFCSAIIENPSRGQTIRSFTVFSIWEKRWHVFLHVSSRFHGSDLHRQAGSAYRWSELTLDCINEANVGTRISFDLPLHIGGASRFRPPGAVLSPAPRLLAPSPSVRIPLPNLQHYDGPTGLVYLAIERHTISADDYAWANVDREWEGYSMENFRAQAGILRSGDKGCFPLPIT